jgi:hypothetical protein
MWQGKWNTLMIGLFHETLAWELGADDCRDHYIFLRVSAISVTDFVKAWSGFSIV